MSGLLRTFEIELVVRDEAGAVHKVTMFQSAPTYAEARSKAIAGLFANEPVTILAEGDPSRTLREPQGQDEADAE